MAKEYLKIREGLYIDLEDFYENVVKVRNVKTVTELPIEE